VVNKAIGLIAAFAASLGTSAMAAETWRCDLPEENSKSYVGGPLAFSISDDGKNAVVNSPMILAFIKTPVEVDLKKNDAKVLRAAWTIKNLIAPDGKTLPNMRFSAVLQKATGHLDYYMRPLSYDNTFGAAGKCVRYTQ
jgi:hypothetical protein